MHAALVMLVTSAYFLLCSFVTIFRKDDKDGRWMYFVDMVNTQNANPQGDTQNAIAS